MGEESYTYLHPIQINPRSGPVNAHVHAWGQCGQLFWLQKKKKRKLKLQRSEIYPCKTSGFIWESFFFFWLKRQKEKYVVHWHCVYTGSLALRCLYIIYKSAKQISVDCSAAERDKKSATGRVGTAEGAAGKNRHMERCDRSKQRSQPTHLFRLFWPPADKGTSRKHTSLRSLPLALSFPVFNNDLFFHFISMNLNHLTETCKPLKCPRRYHFSATKGYFFYFCVVAVPVVCCSSSKPSLWGFPIHRLLQNSFPNQFRHCSDSSHLLALILYPYPSNIDYLLYFFFPQGRIFNEPVCTFWKRSCTMCIAMGPALDS